MKIRTTFPPLLGFQVAFSTSSLRLLHLIDACRLSRAYTKGAEKLFHKVDWDRAVGLVIVVDPFDPGSLLYLPQAGYTDLIKTALANRSPLVVVHGLNDEIPTVTTEVDTSVRPNVEYRVFTVSGKEVHRVPVSSQNSPHPFGSATSPRKRGGKGPSGTGSPESPLVVEESTASRRTEASSLGQGFNPSPEQDLRSQLGVAIQKALRESSDRLHRQKEQRVRVRNWQEFLPEGLKTPQLRKKFLDDLSNLRWPGKPVTHRRRPYETRGSCEAILLHLYTWVGATLLARSARSLQWSFLILGRFLQIWGANGLKVACSNFVEAKRCLMKYISGEPVKVAEKAGVPLGISKEGLPTLLPRGLRRYIIAGHVTAIRLAFFCLGLADVLKYEAPAKLSTITAPYNGILKDCPELRKEIREAVAELVKEAGGRPRRPSWNGFHATIKAGPFAKALVSAPLDACAIVISGCWEHFLTIARLTPGAGKLVSHTEWLAWMTRTLLKPFWSGRIGSLPTGKLSHVIEPRGKIRVVAIPGYQVQCLLRPLHDVLFRFLKNLEQDHTFDQERGVIRAIESGHNVMNSYDLSAATDRFPRWFEAAVLSMLLETVVKDSDEYANAWSSLLEELVFSYRKTRNGRYEEIRYGAGQPMGTYSSWASFAVSHHVVVKMAAKRCNFDDFTDYELLGDDIILRGDTDLHDSVFTHYRTLMGDLGVGINPLKGVSSKNACFEFAKRFVRGGEILSSLRYKELASATSWKGVYTLLLGMSRRGLPLPQLRVALETGFVLINKMPLKWDLTNPRRVDISGLRVLREPIVLLTGPTGPYKVPLVAWLSGRGTFLVDFHPNLGHFINSIERIFMGYEIQWPIAIALKQVRETLIKRIVDIHATCLPTLKALLKTLILEPATPESVYGVKPSPSEYVSTQREINEQARSISLWKRISDHREVTDSLRSIDFSVMRSLTDVFTYVGANYRTWVRNGIKDVLFIPVGLKKSRDYLRTESDDLMVGLIRSIVTLSPAHLVNVRGLSELLGLRGNHTVTKVVDPDSKWSFGASQEVDQAMCSDTLDTLVETSVRHICPTKFKHPSQMLHELRECITDFMKIGIADVLPSALPSHLDLKEVLAEAEASTVLRAWRLLRQDPQFTTKTIFTLPEGTDRSLAPIYLLEYTNSIRMDTRNPDTIPRPNVVEGISRHLATDECMPLVYTPEPGYEAHFVRRSDLDQGKLELLNTALPDTPKVVKSLLCDTLDIAPRRELELKLRQFHRYQGWREAPQRVPVITIGNKRVKVDSVWGSV